MPQPDMIEQMARAAFAERFGTNIGERWDTTSESDRQSHRDMIRAALMAAIEPTEAMMKAALGASVSAARITWRAMVRAALSEAPHDRPADVA